MSLSHLLNSSLVSEKVKEWLKEDIPSFDYGGFVVGSNEESAVLLCKAPGILAGILAQLTLAGYFSLMVN